MLAACASPTARVEQRAAELQFQRQILNGAPFLHLSFARRGPVTRALHVYIENDGRPWASPRQVSADPTPREPVMLEAMALDPGPALYLGRPCYFIADQDKDCDALLWTHRRYAPEVVASMAAALRDFLRDEPYPDLVFFGHSGGGTLAVLLAEHFGQSRAVVTLAANLDVAGWTRLHGFSPLAGSLDPARRPPLPGGILQWHLAGADDKQLPPHLAQGYATRHPDAQISVHPDQDHACCWLNVWPQVLERLDRRRTGNR